MFKSIKSVIRIFIFAIITIVIAGIIIKIDYTKALQTPNSDNQEKIAMDITDGQTVDQILQSLVDKGLLRQGWVNYVKVYLKLNDLSSKIQAGSFKLPKNLNIVELINSLQHGEDPEIWVTIPEGLRKDQIADTISNELTKNNITTFSKEEFLQLTKDTTYISSFGFKVNLTDLEGYLFPDKYAFETDITTKEILDTLVNTFKSKVGIEDSYETIILASIVEREGYSEKDRPTIAGILAKRKAEGWLIQADATLLYYKKDWKAEITQADKQNDNPYNTYKNFGYPPTPICNPGLEAIQAARNPLSSAYYYYIHDDDGVVHYARTLDEHNQNIQTYLR